MAGIRFRYDPREFQGRRYWERGFLSCLIAGAKIPPQITPDLFRVPRNRVIFQAFLELEKLDIGGIEELAVFLRESGRLEAAGGETYLREIETMIGIPFAVRRFTLGLLRFNLGGRV
jgi:hypothetical protein